MGAIVENILIKELISNDIQLRPKVDLGYLIELFGNKKLHLDDNENEIIDLCLFNKVKSARNLIHPKEFLKQIKQRDNIIKQAEKAFEKILQDFNMEL